MADTAVVEVRIVEVEPVEAVGPVVVPTYLNHRNRR